MSYYDAIVAKVDGLMDRLEEKLMVTNEDTRAWQSLVAIQQEAIDYNQQLRREYHSPQIPAETSSEIQKGMLYFCDRIARLKLSKPSLTAKETLVRLKQRYQSTDENKLKTLFSEELGLHMSQHNSELTFMLRAQRAYYEKQRLAHKSPRIKYIETGLLAVWCAIASIGFMVATAFDITKRHTTKRNLLTLAALLTTGALVARYNLLPWFTAGGIFSFFGIALIALGMSAAILGLYQGSKNNIRQFIWDMSDIKRMHFLLKPFATLYLLGISILFRWPWYTLTETWSAAQERFFETSIATGIAAMLLLAGALPTAVTSSIFGATALTALAGAGIIAAIAFIVGLGMGVEKLLNDSADIWIHPSQDAHSLMERIENNQKSIAETLSKETNNPEEGDTPVKTVADTAPKTSYTAPLSSLKPCTLNEGQEYTAQAEASVAEMKI